MAQIFHRSTNALARIVIFGAVFILGFLTWIVAWLDRSNYATRAMQVREQPVPFSHAHHVGGLGLDCRYCHTTVETSSFANIPPTKTCMNCHSEIWLTSPTLEPVRASFRTGASIRWTRVNDLPDFVYFNHSIHINKGIGCESCHGRVDRMPLTWQENSLQMEWCLDCHRHPEKHVRPREFITAMGYQPAGGQEEMGRRLVKEFRSELAADGVVPGLPPPSGKARKAARVHYRHGIPAGRRSGGDGTAAGEGIPDSRRAHTDQLFYLPSMSDLYEHEFPPQAIGWSDDEDAEEGRRNFLKLMGASLALAGLTGCTRQPTEQIMPYVRQPEDLIPGKPLFYATAATLGGVASGVLVESHEGRPTKIEGNPDHPATLGACDVFSQASVL